MKSPEVDKLKEMAEELAEMHPKAINFVQGCERLREDLDLDASTYVGAVMAMVAEIVYMTGRKEKPLHEVLIEVLTVVGPLVFRGFDIEKHFDFDDLKDQLQ